MSNATKYYSLIKLVLWITLKNFEIIIRHSLSAIFAVGLAIWTLIIEVPKFVESPEHIRLTIILLIIATILAAVWEIRGDKLEFSKESVRLIVTTDILLSELTIFINKIKLVIGSNVEITKEFDIFLDNFLNATCSALKSEKSKEVTGVLLLLDNDVFKFHKASKDTKDFEQLTIPLDYFNKNSLNYEKFNIWETANIYLPNNSLRFGHYQRLNSEYETFSTYFSELIIKNLPSLKSYRSILFIPITTHLQKEIQLHGLLIYITKEIDGFIKIQNVMATCYSKLIGQAYINFKDRFLELTKLESIKKKTMDNLLNTETMPISKNTQNKLSNVLSMPITIGILALTVWQVFKRTDNKR